MSLKSNALLILFSIVFLGFVYLFYKSGPAAYIAFALTSILSVFMVAFYIILDRTVKDPIPPKLKNYPTLSIIVPCYNASSTLHKCLDSILSMKYPKKYEVMLINDASTDDTLSILKEYETKDSRVRVIDNKQNMGKANSLNNGIKKARTELVTCIDSDTYPKENALMKGVPYFSLNEKIGIVTFFVTAANVKNWIQRLQELEYFNGFGFIPKTTAKIDGLMVAPGPMSIFKKKFLDKIGGFDANNLTEDMEIGLRMQDNGYKIAYAKGTFIPTEIPTTFRQLYKQRVRWYRGTIFNLTKYKHMILNKEFEHFGLFTFPVVTYYVIITLFSFTVIIGRILSYFFNQAYLGILFIQTGTIPRIVVDETILTFSSVLLFVLLVIGIWVFYYINSIKMIGQRFETRFFGPFILVFLLYPFMISFFYISSLIKELSQSEASW